MSLSEQIHDHIVDLQNKYKFSGVVLVRQGDNTVFSDSFGYANLPWKVENKIDTCFDTASMTKLFTAIATLQLVEKGEFTLNTSVIEFLHLKDSST